MPLFRYVWLDSADPRAGARPPSGAVLPKCSGSNASERRGETVAYEPHETLVQPAERNIGQSHFLQMKSHCVESRSRLFAAPGFLKIVMCGPSVQ
jgi:hypothetical protein